MPWLSVLSGVLKLGSVLAEWMQQKGLLDAGAAQAVAESNSKALDDIARARAARRRIRTNNRLHDEFDRDRK